MTERIVGSRFFNKLSDILIPVFSWIIITLPIWLSPFHPAIVAYLIIAFDIYFFYRALKTVYYAALSHRMITLCKNISYFKKVLAFKESPKIQHFIIIPNYKEPLHKLDETIEKMAISDYPYKNIYLVLAFEKRETEAHLKARTLIDKYKNNFKDILVAYHELLPNEVAGKASNQTYAARVVDEYVQNLKLKREDVLITIADADSQIPKNYFSYLTYKYLRDSDRLYHFYWAPVLLYNNFWQLPFFVRMQATMSSILRLAFLSQKDELIQISTYSTSLWLLEKLNYWDVDIIPEDWHIYFQAFFQFGERVKTIPVYTIISGDAVYSGGVIKTLKNRYEQERRWASGVSDISYAMKKSFITPHIKFWTKLKKIAFLAETHLLWPTSFFILTISAFIPPLIDPIFKRTVLGFLLPKLTSFILTLSSLMLLFYVYLDIKLRQGMAQKKMHFKFLPMLFIQWYLLPVVSFVLGSLPALDAHTRIIFGKKLDYKVTEKV